MKMENLFDYNPESNIKPAKENDTPEPEKQNETANEIDQYKKRWPLLSEKTIKKIISIKKDNFILTFNGETEEEAKEFFRRYKMYKGEFLKPDEITPEQAYKIRRIRLQSCWVFDGKTRKEAEEFINAYDKYISDFSIKDQKAIKYGHIDLKKKEYQRIETERDMKRKARLTCCLDCRNTDDTCDYCYYKKYRNVYGEYG